MASQIIKLTEVEEYAFSKCSKFVAQIDLTEAIYVNEHAFNDCTEITFSAGNLDELVTIGNNAFTDCVHIGSSGIEITMPKIETIGAYAFKGCTYLNIVDGLENLETLEAGVFQNCDLLTGPDEGINFDNITSVGSYSLYGCKSLTKLSMPNLKDGEWGQDFFDYCTGLKELSLPQLSISSMTYQRDSDGVNVNCEIITMVERAKESLETINLEKLNFEVFNSWTSWAENTILKKVNIASCKALGYAAFVNCKALTDVNAAAATSIGASAFYGCIALETIDLSSVESVGSSAFQNCSSLADIELPCVISIGSYAFSGCSSLATLILTKYYGSYDGVIGSDAGTSIGGWGLGNGYFSEKFPILVYVDLASVETVNDGAFYCHGAIKSIDLRSATKVGGNAFKNCTFLEKINLSSLVLDMSYGEDGTRYDKNIGVSAFSGITDDQCEIWLPSDQAATAVDNVWQGVKWAAIHSVDSDGTCDTLFDLKSESEN